MEYNEDMKICTEELISCVVELVERWNADYLGAFLAVIFDVIILKRLNTPCST